jgi:hypothetical protein
LGHGEAIEGVGSIKGLVRKIEVEKIHHVSVKPLLADGDHLPG